MIFPEINTNKSFVFGFIILVLHQVISFSLGTWQNNPYINNSILFLNFDNFITLSIKYFAVSLLFISSFSQMEKQNYLLNNFYKLCLLVLFIASFIWTLTSFYEFSFQSIMNNINMPMVYTLCFFIYIGFNQNNWAIFLKMCGFFSFFFLSLSFFSFLGVANIATNFAGFNSISAYLVTGFWLLSIYCLCYEQKSIFDKVYVCILMSLCLFIALATGSRSWVIQTILLFVIFSFKYFIKKNFESYVFFIISIFIFILGCYIIINLFPQSFERFLSRVGSDSRSGQYVLIFSQVPILNFILGGGIKAVYETTRGLYGYIDNEFIYMLFHYGIFVFLPYTILTFSSAIRLIRLRVSTEDKYIVAILFLWFLALMGLSVHNVIMFDIKSISISIVAGRCYYIVHNQIK